MWSRRVGDAVVSGQVFSTLGPPFLSPHSYPSKGKLVFFYFLAAQVALPPAAWLEAKQRPPLILGCLTYGRLSDLSEPQVLHL